MRAAVENRERLDARELRERVLEDVREARAQFERSIELNDESEYGHVAIVQLCIAAIEFGRPQSRADSYSAFLAAPESAYYRELLALAEEHLERVRETRAGDRPSRYAAAAEAEIQAFYDDYAALLQGWRNLLDRHDLAKPPIRRQLVRAYRRRAGSWRAAQAGDRARAMELLDHNLRDDPSDTVSLMDGSALGGSEASLWTGLPNSSSTPQWIPAGHLAMSCSTTTSSQLSWPSPVGTPRSWSTGERSSGAEIARPVSATGDSSTSGSQPARVSADWSITRTSASGTAAQAARTRRCSPVSKVAFTRSDARSLVRSTSALASGPSFPQAGRDSCRPAHQRPRLVPARILVRRPAGLERSVAQRRGTSWQ